MWFNFLFVALLLNVLVPTSQQDGVAPETEQQQQQQQPEQQQQPQQEQKEKSKQDQFNDLVRHDGVIRVVVATEKNIAKMIKKNDLVVMLFWVNNGEANEKIAPKDMDFLEVIAQLFLGKKVAVATCEIKANEQFAKDVGVTYTGMIKLFNRGRVTTYFGQRSTDVMLPYMAKTMTPPIASINNKADKKSFDQNDLAKVVAYVGEASKEHKELYNAALNFQPMIPFYVVHDAKLAKMLHLKKINSLQLVKPYEKAVGLAKKGIAEDGVVAFVKQNKRQRITKMRLENLHEVWSIDGKGYVVPVFAVTKTEEGNHFFSVVKSLAKQFEKNEEVSFVWIDPEPFPAMVDYWSRSFNIDPSKPTLGVVNVHKQTSAWFPRPSDGVYDQSLLKKWLKNVLQGKIELIPMNKGQSQSQDETTEKKKDEL
jgi:hypothetical protein